jgi:hypothetical protein
MTLVYNRWFGSWLNSTRFSMKTFHRCLFCLPVLGLLASCATKTAVHAPKPQTTEAQAREMFNQAGRYVAELAGQGLLPGYRTGDQGFLSPSTEGIFDDQGHVLKPQVTFPITLTVYSYLSNVLTSVTNAYYVTKDSQKTDWRLNGSWRWEHEKFVQLEPAGPESAAQKDEYFLVEARINGKPAHLAIDTGATDLTLFSRAATRFGLSITNPPKDVHVKAGQVPFGTTEECEMTILGGSNRTRFLAVDIPAEAEAKADFDGFVGWNQLRNAIIRIDACRGTVTWLDSVPRDMSTWTKFPIRTKGEVLQLEIPVGKRDSSFLFIDTGDFQGVALAPELWRTWKAAHRQQPTTLDVYYAPALGIVVVEESWAEKLRIGPLQLTGVPVKEAGEDQRVNGSVTLGRAALKRLDLIIDGERGVAYLRARQTPPPAYSHNRAGAVFAPVDFKSDDLIAHIVKSGPAWDGGIRDGDVLLQLGDVDATKWRTAPDVKPRATFSEMPAGTAVVLTLRRGQKVFTAKVVLRDILPPQTGKTTQ